MGTTLLLGAGRGAPGTAPSSLLTGLTAYWKLEEASGDRLDSSGNGYTLTDTNTVTQVAGIIGNAAYFTRANAEYLSNTAAALQPNSTQNWSFSIWVKPATTPGGGSYIIHGQPEVGDVKTYIIISGTPARLYRFAGYDSGTDIAIGSWSHIVYTFTSGGTNTGTERFYVNGAAAATASRTGGVPAPSTTFKLGTSATTDHPFDGAMDECGLWIGRALAAGDVTALYGAGSPPAYPFVGVP